MQDCDPMSGANALGIAVRRLNLSMVKLLIEAGANPATQDLDRRNAEAMIPHEADPDLQAQLRALFRTFHNS